MISLFSKNTHKGIALALPVILLTATTLLAGELKPIVLNPNYNHDKWDTQPKDHVFKFAAYTVSFDGKLRILFSWLSYTTATKVRLVGQR